MRIDLWTIGLQTINALVLVWLLARFLFRPVTAIIARRREEADGLLADAAAARVRAESDAAAITRDRAALIDEAATIRAAARKEAAAERESTLDQARTDAEKARREAEVALARDQARMQTELESHAARLAVDIAGELLERVPARSATQALAEQLARDVSALSKAE